MAFNDLLESIGGVGYFQFLNTIALVIPTCLLAMHNFLQNFSAAMPDHHCQLSANDNWTDFSNLTRILAEEALLVASIPLDDSGKPEKCQHFATTQWYLLQPNTMIANITKGDTIPCKDGWTYDKSVLSSTIVTEWDLVCDYHQMRQVAQTIYMAGVLVGAAVLGILSDRFGRRLLLIYSYLQMGICGTCAALLNSFGSYCAFRFLCGMTLPWISLSSISLLVEWTPIKGRTITGAVFGCSFSLGQIVLAGVAYGIRNWRTLQIAVSAPYYIFFLYAWFLPESARWLILKGKYQVALKNLQKVAWVNRRAAVGQTLTLNDLKTHMQTEILTMRSSHSVVDLFRSPAMRRMTFLLSLAWFSMTFAFYGIGLDLQKFGFSIFLVQACFGAIDLPAKLVGTATMGYIGRRATQSGSLILAGLMIVSNLFVPQDMKIVRTVLSGLGKGCLATALTCAYLFSGELYPTESRQTGIGFVSMFGRVGSMMAPVGLIIGDYATVAPPLIYGLAAILAGIGAYFLMETRNRPLPDTIHAIENRDVLFLSSAKACRGESFNDYKHMSKFTDHDNMVTPWYLQVAISKNDENQIPPRPNSEW